MLIAASAWMMQLKPQPQASTPAVRASGATIRLAFGARDGKAARWDGAARVSAGRIAAIEGWRMGDGDSAAAPASWKLATERSRAGTETALGAVAEKGVTLSLEEVAADTRVEVQTPGGQFGFALRELAAGAPLSFLGGQARAERLPEVALLAPTPDDQDYPAIAASGDDVFVAYIEFSHGDRKLESFAQLKEAPANFDWLARPAGGDSVKLVRYSKSQRKWSQPEDVSPKKEDCMRTAVAVDGSGRVWVVWSANRNGNFDLYARSLANGRWSREVRLAQDPGNDLNPVAATDSKGRVWIAWQGAREGNLEVFAVSQQSDGFTAPQQVSSSARSDWDPAIATSPNGEVAVVWDTYDKGDYDVYARTMKYDKRIEMARAFPVGASSNFEARSSAAYDRQGRLWVAYEASGAKWGKDVGVYEKTGVSLYVGHTVRIKCFQGGAAFETAGLEAALKAAPGLTGREGPPEMKQTNPGMVHATTPGPRNSFPRIAIDESGRVFLTFRSGAGERSSVGSIYHQYVMWYDGAQWTRPVEIPLTDGLVDFRPALSSTAPDELLLIGVTDHRKSAARGGGGEDAADTPSAVNTDLVAAWLHPGPAQPAKLTPIAAETAAPMAEEIQAERQSIDSMRRYRMSGLQLMRGEFHRHTEYSTDGGADGPLIDAYRYMIDAANMDWGGCCDHDNGNGREAAWWLQQKLTDAYHLGSSHVPMFSYERSVRYPEGHRNTIMVQRGVRPLPRLPKTDADSPADPAPDTQMLYRYLRQFHAIVASHTSATSMGTDWRDNDPVLEPVVEIYQGERQNYEMPGAPRSPDASFAVGGWRPLGFVSLALKKGYKLGFQSSSDHISTHMSYCNLWVKNRTREGLLEAFRARRIYGATDNILADVRCGGHFMGEEFTMSGSPAFQVHLVGTGPFDNVTIIRDGVVVYNVQPGTRDVNFEWRDSQPQKGTSYYYVRGQQKDGELVWVSPMWIHIQ